MKSKSALYVDGCNLLATFCAVNSLPAPKVIESLAPTRFRTCAFYRAGVINIHIEGCASIGLRASRWSYPGYVIDRTPYGVLQHELGHHVDVLRGKNKGKYYSEFSTNLRRRSKDKPLTGYCPNDAEWFAEMFRLFVTNPDLLRILKRNTYHEIIAAGFKPYFRDEWCMRLKGAPSRIAWQAEKKVEAIRAKKDQTPLF